MIRPYRDSALPSSLQPIMPCLAYRFHMSQAGSFSRGLKIARLYKRNVSGRVTLLPGTELRPVSFNKRQQNEEAFFQKHSWRAHVAPMLKDWETLFPVSDFVSKMQIMLTLHGREF